MRPYQSCWVLPLYLWLWRAVLVISTHSRFRERLERSSRPGESYWTSEICTFGARGGRGRRSSPPQRQFGFTGVRGDVLAERRDGRDALLSRVSFGSHVPDREPFSDRMTFRAKSISSGKLTIPADRRT